MTFFLFIAVLLLVVIDLATATILSPITVASSFSGFFLD